MAKFELQYPTEIIKDFNTIYNNSDKILGEMTRAGAVVVENNIKANVPPSFRDSNIMKCLKLTKSYKIKDGVATKVAFYGYFKNKEGKVVPAPLVANVFEYGRSANSRGGAIRKRPFLRKSFKKKQIEDAMLEAQKKASKGLLE